MKLAEAVDAGFRLKAKYEKPGNLDLCPGFHPEKSVRMPRLQPQTIPSGFSQAKGCG